MSSTIPETNKDVVREVFTTWNNKDRDGYMACHADDVIIHGSDGNVEGLDDLMDAQWGFFDAFPDTRLTLDEVISEGDLVSLRFTATGTHKGTFEGIEPTGKTFEISAMGMVRVADGKITEKWVQMDMLGLLQQLDAVESPAI